VKACRNFVTDFPATHYKNRMTVKISCH